MYNDEIALAVRRMQAFIEESLDAEITLEMLGNIAGYSPWYSAVIFKRLTEKTPFEYIRLLRLSKAALRLRDENIKIIDVALDSEFDTHEGFTRAFTKQFKMTPRAYAEATPPIRLFKPYPVETNHKQKGEKKVMEKTSPVFVRVEDKPRRKMVIRRGVKAEDYFAFCDETDCDVWSVLLSIKEATAEPVGMWLPKKFRKPNTSEFCLGVEVPLDYKKTLPEHFEFAEFPPCKMMFFQGQPFDDDDFGEAIDSMWKTIAEYNPEINGYEWANEDGPRIQLEPLGKRGYIEAKPVKEKNK